MAILSRPVLVSTLAFASVVAVLGEVDEYGVKAFFLCNFARYVEWPAEAFKAPEDPVVICVLGQNPFGNALEQAVTGKLVDGRPLVVRHIAEAARGCNCHILFVNGNESKRFRPTLAALKGSGILTVGETPGFAGTDGIINLKLEGGKVHFEINMERVASERLHISSKLLNLAQIVRK